MTNSKTDMLLAAALANDPRVGQAKNLLQEAVKDHQKKITGIRPANAALKENYKKLLDGYANVRGCKLWLPYLGSGFGKGPLVELEDGSIKYDFISGIGPHYWGHSHPDIISSGIDAALSDIVMQGNLQQNKDAFELSEMLVNLSKLDHCFLTTTGGMANENALKLIFQKKYPACRVLAFDHCFMGRTITLSQITDKPAYRDGIPLNTLVDYIPFYDPKDPEKSTANSIQVLKKCLHRYPKEYAVMCIELIQGDGGFYTAPREFFLAVIEVLKSHNITIFIDEVQTFGRTEELFAFQTFKLQDYVDVVTLGKMSQACATLYTKEYNPRPGLLSQTFIASTSAIRAGKVIISGLVNEGFFGPEGKINQISKYLIKKVEDLAKRYPKIIEGPFGAGTMVAFTAFGGDAQKATKFVLDLFDAGVLAFITGSEPTRVRFLVPAGVVTNEDIDNVMAIVEDVIKRITL